MNHLLVSSLSHSILAKVSDIGWTLATYSFAFHIWYFKYLSLNYLPHYKGCHREQGGSQVVPDDPAVLYEAQNITAQKMWSSRSFSTSHIPSFNSLLATVLYHCLNASSPNLFTPLPYVSLHDPVLLGMVAQFTSASLSLRNTPCFLKQICYEGQYFIWLFPLPDQSFQLFIHLHNTTCIKCQQHVMEKSIKNTVQSWPPACKTQYSYNQLFRYCLYFSQQNKTEISYIVTTSTVRKHKISTSVHKRQGPAHRMGGPLHLSCSTGPTAVGMESCYVPICQFQEGMEPFGGVQNTNFHSTWN